MAAWWLDDEEVEDVVIGELDEDEGLEPWIDGTWYTDTNDQDEVANEIARARGFEIPDTLDLDERERAEHERWLARLAVEG